MGEPTVRRALVAAACRLSTTDNFNNPRQLVRIDGTPVIIHILRGLRSAGITRVVITLGHAGDLLAKEVLAESFGSMTVELVWCEESSWKRGHASNILAARSVFAEDEPFLIVMSDHIFDQRLLRAEEKAARLPLNTLSLNECVSYQVRVVPSNKPRVVPSSVSRARPNRF